jgi:hypothetical protein
VVLVDHVLTIPCFLVMTDVYFVFNIECSLCNKVATTLKNMNIWVRLY